MDKKKLRYAILKKIDNGESGFRENDFGVSDEEFSNQIFFLKDEGYIKGGVKGSNVVYTTAGMWITEKGEDYLESNSTLSKSYTLAKEIRDWIKP